MSLVAISLCAKAQQTLIQVEGWNCYIQLPEDYGQTETSYPTIIFLPGIGEVGTDANKIIANGPGAYVKQGWNGEALGVKFIVIGLQPVNTWPSAASVKQRIDNLRSRYRIGNIYLTGLSMGGWIVLNYSNKYPDEAKAIVSVEGVVPNDGYDGYTGPWYEYIRYYYEEPALIGVKFIVFEQKNDLRGGREVINAVDYWYPGNGYYFLTTFGNGGHCCWSEFYGGQGKQPGIFNIGGINQTIYDWFARANLKALARYITKCFVKNNELQWACENIMPGDIFRIEESTDGITFSSVCMLEAVPGVSSYNYKLSQ